MFTQARLHSFSYELLQMKANICQEFIVVMKDYLCGEEIFGGTLFKEIHIVGPFRLAAVEHRIVFLMARGI